MALTQQQRQAIDRAKQRAVDEAFSVERTYFGEAFTFRFMPNMNQNAIEIISTMVELSEGDPKNTGAKQVRAMADFLDTMATEETAELIADLSTEGIMSLNDVGDVQREVLEKITARPTMRSSSSPAGSPSGGSGSTASALPSPSTPTA